MVLPIWLDENGQRVPPILEEAALLGFVKKTDYSSRKELRESALPRFIPRGLIVFYASAGCTWP